MRGTRRGFTLVELVICTLIVSGVVLAGVLTMKFTVQCRNQRNDQMEMVLGARDALDFIDRLLQRAVEAQPLGTFDASVAPNGSATGGPYPGGSTEGQYYIVSTGGTHPFALNAGDTLTWTNGAWRNANPQTALRNFKDAVTNFDDDTTGLQFYADVDPATIFNSNQDLIGGPNSAKLVEWVWIWWDNRVPYDQTAQPFELRYPLKVAIFRSNPTGAAADPTPDYWTRKSHSFYGMVNSAAASSQKAYLTIAANVGELSMRVEKFAVNAPLGSPVPQIWRKRVAITGALYPDRSSSIPTNPGAPLTQWDYVAPGAQLIGMPGTYNQTPSYALCRTIYPQNLNAIYDGSGIPSQPPGHSFTLYNQSPAGAYLAVRNSAVSWNTGTSPANYNTDFVLAPR